VGNNKRTITFSLFCVNDYHIHGEIWATNIKEVLQENGLLDRPIHVISANMHSVILFFATTVLKTQFRIDQISLFMRS
jgi:hypothetical protein